MSHAPEIDRLIKMLSRLPGVGKRSAQRMALHLLTQNETLMQPLAQSLIDASETIQSCHICGNLDSQNPCSICEDKNRDTQTICVVKSVSDLWAMDKTGFYQGRYHVLGGVLSALDGIGPDNLNIASLLGRIENEKTGEVILALSATVDGQTTMHYIADMLEAYPVKVTRLAHGVPVGGELDYLDDGTILTALKSRSSAL